MRIIIIVVLLIAGCSLASEPEESTTMGDIEQPLLLEELTANGVPFRLDDHGAVWYRVSLRDRVGKIQQRVLARARPLNAVSFKAQSENDNFCAALQERHVVVRRWTDLGQYWVQWNEEDGNTVSTVELALNKQSIKQQYEKKP